MELRKIPGAWFSDRDTWQSRGQARRSLIINHWNVDDTSFPIRMTNTKIAPWLPFLGAFPDPSDSETLCLEQHHLEYYFLGAFKANDADVRNVKNGEGFVLPSRLDDAFEALVEVGLDLTIDPRMTELNGLGPTIFLERVASAIRKLPQLLDLRLQDIVDIEVSDSEVNELSWPSHLEIGSMTCPTSGSLRPFADLRGLQGFYLSKDVRENTGEQFHTIAVAISKVVMVGSLADLGKEHYPRQVARWLSKTMWIPSLSIARLQWPDVLEEVDERNAFQTEDAAKRAVVIRDRFSVLLLSMPHLKHWVSGGTVSQEYEAAIALAQELLQLSDNRSISAFRALDSFLAKYDSLKTVNGMTSSVPAFRRCAALISHILDERRNRPEGRHVASSDSSTSVSNASNSTESVGSIFNNLASYGDVIEEFLRSPSVTGKLVMKTEVDDEGQDFQEIDVMQSGLLALVSHPDIRNNNNEILRVAYLRYSQVVNQFLATKRHYRNPLFATLATAREEMVQFITYALLCDDTGKVREADKEWKVSQAYCDAVVKSGFDSVNHYNEIIVSLEKDRCKSTAPAKVGNLHDQWTQERSPELAVYIDRLANAFGAPRNDTVFGFAAFFRDVDLFIKRTPDAINKGYHKGKMCQEALQKPSERWRLMLRSPPPQPGAPAIVPRTFLRRSDPCFEQLKSRDKATEELMKIDKLIPGALNAISNMASSSASRQHALRQTAPPPSNAGSGNGNGGNAQAKGKGKGKRLLDASSNADANKSDDKQRKFITPGAFASNCTWEGQVLTIKRDMLDRKTNQLKVLAPAIFDIGRFCAAKGVTFNDFCWEFVCSYWLSSYDRAKKIMIDMKDVQGARALRLACARCQRSSDTSNHPEALSGKHKLPNDLASMVTYFRLG